MDLTSISKSLVLIGIIFILCGGVIFLLGKSGINIGKLPGDILIQKGNFTFYFPVISSILISIILTIVINLISKK